MKQLIQYLISILLSVIFIYYHLNPIWSAEIYPHQMDDIFIVDNFEDKNLTKQPKWWAFGDIDVYITENNQKELNGLEQFSMVIKGKRNFPKIVGGVGTFFGANMKSYDALKLPIKGYGKHSGIIMVELYDDDSNDWEITPHPNDPSQVIYDDKFVYHIVVDWDGWKVVIIPLDSFKDANPLFGDNLWNPYHTKTSGGLLQMQLLLFATDDKKNPIVNIDTIKFFNQANVKEIEEINDTIIDDNEFY